jgi:hypothetical protein
MILKRCYQVTQGIILYSIPRRSDRREIEPGTYVCTPWATDRPTYGDKSQLFTKPECRVYGLIFAKSNKKDKFF